jgi:hypothetical protein
MKPRDQLLLLGACLSGQAERRAHIAEGIVSAPWPELLQRAGTHLVTPSLAGTLADAGVLAALPEPVRDYLQTIRDLNGARNRTLYAELARIAAALNSVGIEPQLLKGAVALLPKQYPGAADRVIGDLDLRVPAKRYPEAAAAVRALGYRPTEGVVLDLRYHHHGTVLLHPSAAVAVELHVRSLRDPTDSALLEAGIRVAAVRLHDGGPRVGVADAGTRLLHNFLHGQIGDLAHHCQHLNLRSLLELARLADHHRAEIDWPALLGRLQPPHQRAFRLYLMAAAHWLGAPYPEVVGRPVGGERAIERIALGQSSPFWYHLFGTVGQLRILPRRLLTPGWLGIKLRTLWLAARH